MVHDRKELMILLTHRCNLAESKPFEEYRDHHVAFVDLLIERMKAGMARDAAEIKFIWKQVEPPKDEAPKHE